MYNNIDINNLQNVILMLKLH